MTTTTTTGKRTRKIIRRNEPPPSDWSDLPSDALRLIAGKLTTIGDYIRLRGVCYSWFSAFTPSDRSLNIPYLLLPYQLSSTARSFLDPSDRTVHTVDLPESLGKRLYGATHGWLVMLGSAGAGGGNRKATYTVSLFNPLTRAQISLPNLSTGRMALPEHVREDIFSYTIKTALSANPASRRPRKEEVVIAVMIYSKLATCKLGGESWTFIQLSARGHPHHFMVDIVYFDRALYVADDDGGLTTVDISTMKKKYSASASPPSPPIDVPHSTFHLVVSSGDLLLLERDAPWDVTTAIRVFKLDRRSGRRLKWARVSETIGNRALFVSQNHSSLSLLSQAAFAGGGRRDVICYADAESRRNNDSTVCIISDIVAGKCVMREPYYWQCPRTDPTNDDDLNGLVWIVPNPF